MKKALSLVLCLLVVAALCIPAFAASASASASISGVPSELTKDATATVNVSLSGTPTMSSALVQVSLGGGLELVSGAWQKDGLKDFDLSMGHGVIALSGTGTLDGTAFSFVVKGKTISSAAQNVTVNFTFKNGVSEVGTASASALVKVVCATHSLGAYTNVNANQHTRTCSVCGYVETANHAWDGGSVTKTANCKEAGNKHYTCTAPGCGAFRDEVIPKTENHSFGSWVQTTAPSCTGNGIESGKCTRCGQTTTNTLKATGHKFGAWADTKAATCTEKGAQERKCSKCTAVETRETEALGHQFDAPVVVKEPTLTEKGILEGVCKTCGEKTQSEIPCTFKDEKTGIEITTDLGVFEQGTEIKIEVIEKDHTVFENVKTALKEVASEFVAYDVTAVRENAVVQPNGAVTVSFKIPEGFGKNVALFYISDEGISEKLDATVSEDGSSITATLTHFSSYAVVKLAEAEPAPDTDNDANEKDENVPTDTTPKKTNNVLWIVLVIVVVLAAGGAAAWYFLIFKKKK